MVCRFRGGPIVVAALFFAATAGADPFVDRVVTLTVGRGGGGGSADAVLGAPHGGGAFQASTDTLSLGLDGSIVVAFADNVIVDRPGPDFTVFENPFLVAGTTTGGPFAEPGTVSVSDDGVEFRTFPCRLDSPPFYRGCAGVYPVFANADDPDSPSPAIPSTTPIADLIGVPTAGFVPPAGSGGDSFDLADVGLSSARFVRIDASALQPGLAGLSGFDLDAIAGIHSVECGDVDGNGRVDVADALLVAQITVGLRRCDAASSAVSACDVSPRPTPARPDAAPDGVCNIGDALAIAQCAVGLVPCNFRCGPFRCARGTP